MFLDISRRPVWPHAHIWFAYVRRLASVDKRLGLGYPCACLVVLSAFPRVVPKMTRFLEGQSSR